MLSTGQISLRSFRSVLSVLLLLCVSVTALLSQQTVALLTGSATAANEAFIEEGEMLTTTTEFELVRNLICFQAERDGRPGRYILDTGAPSLVINNRGQSSSGTQHRAQGSGGSVELTDQRVRSFEMGNHTVKNYWAVALDLRGFETRTEQHIEGFVGYDLLNYGELRIDYDQQTFGILKSRRRPAHRGLSPSLSIRFQLDGHLPVITLLVNGERHYFIVDTGAGANLVDPAVIDPEAVFPTGRMMNIQGLDGRPADHPIVRIEKQMLLADTDLVSVDLSHLSSERGLPIAGILGSSFLRDFTVGIDYRRRKVHFW